MSCTTTSHLFAGVLFGVLVFGPATSTVQSQMLEWVRQFGTDREDWSTGVSADGLGNVYVTGHFGVFFLDSVTPVGFVNKYDAAGSLQWTMQLTHVTGLTESTGISADGLGNVYISGNTWDRPEGEPEDYDAFITKYNAAGVLQWTRHLATSESDFAGGISADGFGNAYISGSTGSNASNRDAFVSKYDAAGELQWTRQIGTPQGDSSGGVSADNFGNVYISGTTEGSLGGPYAGGSDAFVSKFDAAGGLLWTQQLGTADVDTSHGVAADQLGNVFITGYVYGSSVGGQTYSHARVAKYDAAGNFQWTKLVETSSFSQSYGVAADGLGNVYISGISNDDAFVSKLDAAGELQWTRLLGTPPFDSSQAISADEMGIVYIAGYTSGDLGGPSAGGRYGGDAFIAKYSNFVIPEPESRLLALACAVVLWFSSRREK